MQLDHDGQATSGSRAKDLAARLGSSDRCVTNRQGYAALNELSRGKHTQIPTLPVLLTSENRRR